MTTPSVHCEARLTGIAKKADKGGAWAQITLQVQPEDLPKELWQAPLGSIFVVAFARVGDDGQPVKQEVAKPKAKREFASLPRSQQAGILCNDETFQQWVAPRISCDLLTHEHITEQAIARQYVLNKCKINSRRELDVSNDAGVLWDGLRAQFEIAAGRATEARG